MNKDEESTVFKSKNNKPQKKDPDNDKLNSINAYKTDLIAENSKLKIELAQSKNTINQLKQINKDLKKSINNLKPKNNKPQQGEDNDEVNSTKEIGLTKLVDIINSLRLVEEANKMTVMSQSAEISRLRLQNDILIKCNEETKCSNIIIHARYHKLDVTDKLVVLLNGSGEILLPNTRYPLNHLFSDPAPGETKFLLIVYKVGNDTRSLFWREKDAKDNLALKLW
jgi:hypothetical protein